MILCGQQCWKQALSCVAFWSISWYKFSRSLMITNALTCDVAIPLLGSCPGDTLMLVQNGLG